MSTDVRLEPATVDVSTSPEDGGVTVTVHVPCSEGVLDLVIDVERDREGDWRVFIPWPENGDVDEGIGYLPGDYEVVNGILYLAAPE